jgi:DNA-binding protein Fis
MRTLATLGGGVAHQLRNSVTGSNIALDLHAEECAAGRSCESLSVARRQLQLMEEYIRRFLQLGKRIDERPHALIMSRGRPMQPEHLPRQIAIPRRGATAADAEAAMVAAVGRWARQNVDKPELQGQLYECLISVIEPPMFNVALERHKGQFASAARALGIHRTTLRKKLPDRLTDEAGE